MEWQPERILDIATGTGDLALELQRVCPDSEIIGSDFCPEMLEHAKTRGVEKTQVVDAMKMPFEDDSCDVLTVAFGLRNMSNWADALKEMKRVIRKGGHLLVLDFSLPEGILRKPYGFYLNKLLPKIAGKLTKEEDAYTYLAGTIEQFPSGKAMCDLISEQGFTEPRCETLSGGIASIYTAEA
eukprot:Seg19520.2 transcript_id=Seg19520.2/GoldUCD/mRNA.D3Y31 product="Demethylmenaquinone methyltransferase" protein_id=Seg19520.2/GoldUCD/D3Y31